MGKPEPTLLAPKGAEEVAEPVAKVTAAGLVVSQGEKSVTLPTSTLPAVILQVARAMPVKIRLLIVAQIANLTAKQLG